MRLLRLAAGACAGVSMAMLSGAGFGAAQLFKCVDGGRTVYQQQACPVSSQAEPASAPRTARSASAIAEAASAPARKVVKPPPSPASAALATSR